MREELTFRPYAPFTLFVPNPARLIKASLDHLTVQGPTGVVLQILLPASSVRSAPGFGNALNRFFLNRGAVLVTDAGGKEHLLRRLPDVDGLTKVLTGTHKGLSDARAKRLEMEARREKLDNLRDSDLAGCVLFYPHVPRTVDRFLRAREPDKYNEGSLGFLVRERDGVEEGQPIAKYGDFTMTAPFAGRIEFIGSREPGSYDWPGLIDSTPTAPQGELSSDRELREASYNSIDFPSDARDEKAFAFGLRPLADSKLVGRIGYYSNCNIRTAFDCGNVWLDMEGGRGYTLYSVIDMAVYDVKSPGSGIPIPERLRAEEGFGERLLPYWNLINSAHATIRYPSGPA